MERKIALTEEFYLAKKFQKPPPEVTPHPDHVQVSPTDLAINGPLDAESRKIWEQVKLALRIAACQHGIIRDEYRRNPSEAVKRELKAIESHRRRLMRTVPKGWNWQEEVYCRDSMLDLAKDTVRHLERIGYVSSNVDD